MDDTPHADNPSDLRRAVLPVPPTSVHASSHVSFGAELRTEIIRFAVGDAMGGLFTQAWTYILPILIAASLGPSVNALFYTSFLFSSTIDQVAANYASPLIVEGAHAPEIPHPRSPGPAAYLSDSPPDGHCSHHCLALAAPCIWRWVCECSPIAGYAAYCVFAKGGFHRVLCILPSAAPYAQICNYAGVRLHSYPLRCCPSGSLAWTDRCRTCGCSSSIVSRRSFVVGIEETCPSLWRPEQ